jgi:hypothetical protein
LTKSLGSHVGGEKIAKDTICGFSSDGLIRFAFFIFCKSAGVAGFAIPQPKIEKLLLGIWSIFQLTAGIPFLR